MKNILNYNLPELETELIANGEKKYRSLQIFKAIHANNINDIESITELSLELREKLSKIYSVELPDIVKKQKSQIDGTAKYLFKFEDGNTAETVLMRYDGTTGDGAKRSKSGWNSICVSTQVGCKMGCEFCASGKAGFVRNLTSGEILAQIYAVERDAEVKITSVVMMGIGEPLDNFDETINFISTITNPKGRAIGVRHITISTCGLADKIKMLADLKIPVNLSISLHAVDDEKRGKMMPVNRKYNIEELLSATRYYFEKTGRRISFEYALIAGENDDEKTAQKLAKLVKPICSHVNIIPLNETKSSGLHKSKNALIFRDSLNKSGIAATIRRTLGADIDAACGQLRCGTEVTSQ